MPRKPKPHLYRGNYVSEAGGIRRILCCEAEGLAAAERKLAELLAADAALEAASRPKPPPILLEGDGLAPVGPRPPEVFTVGELCERFLTHARTYYRHPDGTPTGEAENYRHAFRQLRDLHAGTAAEEFGKSALKEARQRMIAAGLSRRTVNSRVSRIKAAFAWAAEEELVPDVVAASLRLVRQLKAGRTEAPERDDVPPVPLADLEASLPHMTPPVAAMCRLMLYSGMRPGEVRKLRGVMVDRSAVPWVVDFGAGHKTGHKGKHRRVVLGPKARELLSAWVRLRDLEGYVFQPCDAVHANRRKRLLPYYSKDALRNAVVRAAREAKVPEWAPNQIRHLAATLIRAKHGPEAAQLILGHAHLKTTEIYALRDEARMAAIVEEEG